MPRADAGQAPMTATAAREIADEHLAWRQGCGSEPEPAWGGLGWPEVRAAIVMWLIERNAPQHRKPLRPTA